jgi:hypothetical protein
MNSHTFLHPAPSRGQISVSVRARIALRMLAMPLLALATAAFAQTPVMTVASGVPVATHSTLTGKVLDPTRAIIPGAEVQLKRVDGTVVSSAVTDSAGHFLLTQPAPGDYHLSVVLPGFTPLDRALRITASPLAPLTLTMDLAGVVTSVTVNADQDQLAAAPENNSDAATVSTDDMKSLPIFDADIVATLSAFLDAGVAGEGGTTLMVDGIESKTVGVSPSAIERVSVNQDPYSAEYRQPGRGQIEIITKSTADHFHGSVSFTFRDAALNATNYFATSKPPEQRRIYEGYLTGPIKPLRDTAFLFSLTRKEEDTFTQVLATTLPTVMPAQNITAPTRSTNLSMKVSHQFNERHSAYVLYRLNDASEANQTVGGLVQEPDGYVDYTFDMDLTFHDDFTLSANKLNQFDVRFERNLDRIAGNQQTPQVMVEGVATFGGAQQDAYNTENNPSINDTFSWTLATHMPQQIKFGVQISDLGRRILDDETNRQGTYTFASAAAFAANTPASFSIQQGQSRFQTLYARPGAFVLDEIQATPRLTVTPGLRYDFQNTLSNTKDGLEPRLTLAYLVDKAHALVIRTGGGLFIRRVGVNIGQQLARYQFAAERSLLLTTNLCYPDITVCNALAAQPPSLFTYQPGLQAPEQAYFGLSIERQLTKNSTVSLGYNGYRGWHALRSVDINAPLPPFASPARPNPNFAQVLQLQSAGYQKTDGMSLSYRGRIGNAFSGFMQYTLQHADTNTTFSTFIPQNQYNPNDEWSRSDFDQRQRLALFGTFYPDKPITLGLGFYNNTPLPYTITTGTDVYQTGLFNARPAGVPRNSLNGGSFQDVQLRLNYNHKLHPRLKDDASVIALSLSSFNTLNRANFSNYDGVITSPDFRQPTTASDPRRLQLSASYSF